MNNGSNEKHAAAKLDVFPSCGFVGEGERSDAVGAVQMILNTLKIRYDAWDFLDVSFALDEPTALAVGAFRQAHGFADDPGIDLVTWNALASEYALLRELE